MIHHFIVVVAASDVGVGGGHGVIHLVILVDRGFVLGSKLKLNYVEKFVCHFEENRDRSFL